MEPIAALAQILTADPNDPIGDRFEICGNWFLCAQVGDAHPFHPGWILLFDILRLFSIVMTIFIAYAGAKGVVLLLDKNRRVVSAGLLLFSVAAADTFITRIGYYANWRHLLFMLAVFVTAYGIAMIKDPLNEKPSERRR